jgi:predicted CXXCH cytochrome family protein
VKRIAAISATVLAMGLTAVLSAASESDYGCRTGPCHRGLDEGALTHAPFREGKCRPCHKGSAARQPDGTGAEFSLAFEGGGGLCYTCHRELEEAVKKSGSIHRPVREGACLRCHEPHTSSFRALLEANLAEDVSSGVPASGGFGQEDFELCWRCHDVYMVLLEKTLSRTAFRNAGLNLHYLHVRGEKGYTCKACHRYHAADGEKLIGRPMGWTGDLVRYVKLDDGGECSPGCHVKRSYSRAGR